MAESTCLRPVALDSQPLPLRSLLHKLLGLLHLLLRVAGGKEQSLDPRGEALFRCARPSGVPRGPATSTGSLASQRHPGKFPKVPGRQNPGGKRAPEVKATATLQLLLHCAHQVLGVRGLGSDPASALKDPQSSGEEKYAHTGLLCGMFSVITDTHKATDPTKSMTRSKGEISGLRERR